MKTKVKVKRSELMRVVEGRIRKLEKDHERAVAAYPDRVAKHKADTARILERAARDAKAGKTLRLKYGNLELPDPPMKPAALNGEACNLRRALATLKIGAEETILLSQEDAAVYFGPCKS